MADDMLPDGAPMVFDHPGSSGGPRFCLVAHTGTPQRYGVVFVEPTSGATNGSSGWSYPATSFRPPRSLIEHVWVWQWAAARRQHAAERDLHQAVADVDALARVLRLAGEGGWHVAYQSAWIEHSPTTKEPT